MLRLINIKKDYIVGPSKVEALKGVSLDFRKNEFVSILGQSGCGKTTLLNIIGGLDKYTDGDLVINGTPTKYYKDRDWDIYRNHSVGFVFQSYNLIPHQTVLSNVELALTLSGVSKKERRGRAIEALEKVGLGDQLNKKPNQMSGGQMQRVAIARALVNNPDILLADEPTGALDSATSVQVMDILKEIAKEKLVIMVTHNPEIAENYSTRIIKLLDGEVISDSNPYESETPTQTVKPKRKKRVKAKSMSFLTALSLSFNNLMTKKARTFMTSFAGSIGIIGIALILSLSNGIQLYIDKVEEDTLSNYPITIEEAAVDMSSMMLSMMDSNGSSSEHDLDKIYSNNIMTDMMNAMNSGLTTNNLEKLKVFLDNNGGGVKDYITDIKYGYSTVMNIYKADTSNGVYQVNPGKVFENLGIGGAGVGMGGGAMQQMSNMDVWKELVGDNELLESQYDIVKGKMPEKHNEVVLIVTENNEITDYTLYTLGMKSDEELKEILAQMQSGEESDKEFEKSEIEEFTFDEILALRFKLLVNTDYFQKENGIWVDKSQDEIYMIDKVDNAEEIKVVGILRPKEDTSVSTVGGTVGYTSALREHLINRVNDSEIVKEQKQDTKTDVFSGLPFKTDEDKTYTMDDIRAVMATLPAEQQAQLGGYIAQMSEMGTSEEKMVEILSGVLFKSSDATYDGNLSLMGVSDLSRPSIINIYPKDFEAKDTIADIISKYNDDAAEADKITYTDYIGIMMSSVTTIINAISYILIAFVAISLVVSSIMIGIITYISVLERTKEIGILRAVGASKKDISRVFNAETLIVGFVAGIIGIGGTLLLIIPINAIIQSVADINASAQLPAAAAIILVGISMLLTFVAGLFPSRVASKKDPVVALRTE